MDRRLFILVLTLSASIAPMAGSPVDVDREEFFENFLQNVQFRLDDDQVGGSAKDSTEVERQDRPKTPSEKAEDEPGCVREEAFCETHLNLARCREDARFLNYVKSLCCNGTSSFAFDKHCPNTMKVFRNRARNLCDDDVTLDPVWFGADTKTNKKLCWCPYIYSSCDYYLAKLKPTNDQQFKDALFHACCSGELFGGRCLKEQKKFDQLFPQSCKNYPVSVQTDDSGKSGDPRSEFFTA